jgi:hypothetical protein
MIEDRSNISLEKPEKSREARGAHLKSVTRRALDLCGVHGVRGYCCMQAASLCQVSHMHRLSQTLEVTCFDPIE